MKALHFIVSIALFGSFLPTSYSETPTQPTSSLDACASIKAIRGRKVRVQVPEGFTSVTLQRRLAKKGRPWVEIKTQTTDGAACEVEFKLRNPLPKRMLRVLASKNTPLPANFLTGISEFQAETGASDTGGKLSLGGVDSVSGNTATLSLSANASVSDTRGVVEADIWKLEGDRLYFFNQFRGLQVIDVSDPANPAMASFLRMPASGKDMYVVGDYAVLLKPRWNWWNGVANSELLVCKTNEKQGKVIAKLDIEGTPVESRMVGSALYIATNQYVLGESNQWRHLTKVTGYDLSDPTHPIKRNTVETSANGWWNWADAVWANDHYFVVANAVYDYTASGYRTELALVDISNPDGTVVRSGTANIKGAVRNKFNIQEKGGFIANKSG
jgi:Beta propeller domain